MNRILIIKLGALGDVVMSTPLVDAIVRHHAGDELTLLTTPPFAPLFAAWPELEVVARPRAGLRNAWNIVRWMRRSRFDRIYDLQGNDRSALWCALSGARARVGNHNRYPYTHHPADAWHGQCHIFERMAAVLRSAGIEAVDALPRLPRTAADITMVEAWCAERALTRGQFVVLHGGASAHRPNKIWPYFADFAQRLRETGLAVIWIGGAPDRARNAAYARVVGIDATEAFTLSQLAILGSHARFAVTNDSGPMHVLSASGIPVFALFGPSNWLRNHALGQAHRVLACIDHVSGMRDATAGDCLKSISVDALWARLRAEALV